MTPIQALIAIKKYGLSIRQIPTSITECNEIRHKREGDEVYICWGREMCRRTKIPDKAGYWMCHRSHGTSSTDRWSYKDDFLAPTLEESVEKCVHFIENTRFSVIEMMGFSYNGYTHTLVCSKECQQALIDEKPKKRANSFMQLPKDPTACGKCGKIVS